MVLLSSESPFYFPVTTRPDPLKTQMSISSLVTLHLPTPKPLTQSEVISRICRLVLEKEMATHSSILAWIIPGTGSLVGCRLWGRTESDMTEVT